MSVNRRAFFSMLLGAAGAPLVPWRGLVEPVIFLPARRSVDVICRVDLRLGWTRDFQRILAEEYRIPEKVLFGPVLLDQDSEQAARQYFSEAREMLFIAPLSVR